MQVDSSTPSRLTARDILVSDPAVLAEQIETALAADEFRETLPAVLRTLSATAGKFITTQAVQAIDDLLKGMNLDQLILGSWMKLQDLQTALEETASDGGSQHVALAEHRIVSEHAPSLEVVMNSSPIRLLDLELNLSLEIDACEVIVTDGTVCGAKVGSMAGRGELRGAGRTLLKRETEQLDLARLFDRPSEA